MTTLTNTKHDFQTNYQITDNEVRTLPKSQVVTLNADCVQHDKNTANEIYAREQGPKLQTEGYRDAVTTWGNTIQLESKLLKVKKAYILWCEKNQHLYKREHEDAMGRHEELIGKYRQEVIDIECDMKPWEEKISAFRKEVDNIHNHNYKLVDSLKVLLCLTAWLALGFWLAFYYGSAFHLTQISAADLINLQGEVVQLFTLENMLQGWPLALFPIATGILAGFMGNLKKGGLKIFVVEMLLFASMDIALSLLIEKRIGEGFSFMGEQHSFDWGQFWLIIMYGTVGAFFFSLAGYKLNQSLLMDEWNTKRTTAAEAERLLDKANLQLFDLQKRKNAITEQLNNEENMLRRRRNDDIYTHWYNGTTIEYLLYEYFDGWLHAIANVLEQEQEKIEQLQKDGREILKKVVENK